MVKVVYEKKELEHDIKQNFKAMTATHLASDKSATANNDQPEFIPEIVNGRMLPSKNTYYHQQKAQFKSLLPTYQTISKKLNTIKTKLYRAGDSLLIHADVNGSLNILIFKKLVPIALSLGV
jgi:putative transposase